MQKIISMQNKITKIYLASDHAGFELKEKVKLCLNNLDPDFEIEDCGAKEYVEGDDYTDYIHKAAFKLSEDASKNLSSQNKKSVAFVFGGSGEGEAIVMNRYVGVRCTTYYGGELDIVKLGREHNDANSISFGARFLDYKECIKAVSLFLETDFEAGRHEKRAINIDHKLGFLSRFFS